jgi:hypothetical protein
MLWYKSWLDTRWRFLVGLALLACSAFAVIVVYPRVVELLPLVPDAQVSGAIGRRIKEAAELSRDYRGYIWTQWFRQNPTQMGTLFAVLLGSGGLASQAGGGTLFTLSLPVSRTRLVGVRAATGLAECLALAVVPSLLIPLFSPAIDEHYALGAAMVHAGCLFVPTAMFFSLALFLSTVFLDLWKPLLIALGVAVAIGLAEAIVRDAGGYGVFAVMSGERYFRTGSVPWLGLAASAAASAALLWGAAASFARRDF